MKILKFILATFLILLITAGIPIYSFYKGTITQYFSKVEGVPMEGPAGYLQKIIQDENATQDIKNNSVKLLQEYSNVYVGEKKDVLNLFFCTSLLLGLTIITFGIVLLKIKHYKIVSLSIITAGTISTIIYILIYVSAISVLPPFYNL